MAKGERNAGQKLGKISIALDVYELLEVSLVIVGQVTKDDNRPDRRHNTGRLNDVVHLDCCRIYQVKWYRSFVTHSIYSLSPSWRSV